MPIKKRVGNPTNLTAAEVDGNFDLVEADIAAEAAARDAAIAAAVPTKATLALDLVDNTADVDKPVSAAQAAAIAAKADLQAGALAASTTAAPNATAVQNAIAALVASAPSVLDTLNELATALANDPNFATTMTTALANKQAALVSGTNIKTVNGTSLLGPGDVPVIGGATTFAALTDAASVDLVATNTALAAALATKVPILAPYALTGDNALTAAAHYNRSGSWTGLVAGTITIPNTGNDSDFVELSNDSATVSLTFVGPSAAAGMTNVVGPGVTYQAKRTNGSWKSVTSTSLVSGATIKTLNGGSLLGAGDVAISGVTFAERERHFRFSPMPSDGNLSANKVGIIVTLCDASTFVANTAVNGVTKQSAYPRTRVTSVAAVSRMAGVSMSDAFLLPIADPAIPSTQRIRLTAMISDALPSGQFLMGVCLNVPALTVAVEPSSLTNFIALAADSVDGQLKIMHNAAATATKVTLNGGVGFPSNTSSLDIYRLDLTMQSVAGVSTFPWTVTNLVTGVTASGVVATNFPANGMWAVTPVIARGSAANAAAASVDIIYAGGGREAGF